MLNRQKWRRVLRVNAVLLIVAVLSGAAAAALAVRYLGTRAAATEASLRSRYEMRAVVVAAADLGQGETLDAARLAARQMPRQFVPADAVPVERAAELIGGRTAVAIRRGTPVIAAALSHSTDAPRLSSLLAGGRRALTIAVDQVNSQAGNLLAGDWVDLYYTGNEGGGAYLIPLMQRVQVMATGASLAAEDGVRDVSGDERHFGTITLGLSATDAARVLLAQQSGSVSVVLRSREDQSEIPWTRQSSVDLLPRNPRRSIPVLDSRVEVLVGGGGGLVPERSWLLPGSAMPLRNGEPS